jgi:hypothetical protein
MVRREVEYQSLSISCQADIAGVLIDHSDYLTAEWWADADFREVLVDLSEPIKVSIAERPVRPLMKQVALCGFSEIAVKKLQERLSVVGDLDPVIFDGNIFIDGRHRVEAYARVGRRMIPIVDIGALLRTDWEKWING